MIETEIPGAGWSWLEVATLNCLTSDSLFRKAAKPPPYLVGSEGRYGGVQRKENMMQ